MADAAHTQNLYKADLRDVMFTLFEHFKLNDLLGKEPYEDWGEEEVRGVLAEIYRFSCEVLGPLNQVGDVEGTKIVDGKAVVPSGFKEAYDQLYEMGFKGLGVKPEFDGQGAPKAVFMMAEEMLTGANTSLSMYPGLTIGAAELVEAFGTEEQRERYCMNMFTGKWGGTMCLTEAEAGSDVGASRSKATKNDDGTYNIEGTKIFISSGDHELSENIVHMVLARIEGAPPGTKGLSLFVVPKYRINEDGTVGESNDVQLGGLEHKMGIHGSTTCVLNFGENGKCVGELLGKENEGMRLMFKMMNSARIFVGIQGLANASTAYLNALSYCRDRKQGSSIENFKDASAPRVTIINHPDVRRMLLDMKSRVEGVRALAVKLSMHQDFAEQYKEKDPKEAAKHQGQVDLLVPIIKGFGTDEAYKVCVTAIQSMGGAGYIADYGVEQYARDSRIFTIYEGTNHIQAMDLVGRKLGQKGGSNFQALLKSISKFVKANQDHESFGDAIKLLDKAQQALGGGAMQMLMWAQSGKLKLVDLYANQYMTMMGYTTVAWLLLEAALIAEAALPNVQEGHPDKHFYEGKIAAALFYARTNLPTIPAETKMMQSADMSAIDIAEEAFATI